VLPPTDTTAGNGAHIEMNQKNTRRSWGYPPQNPGVNGATGPSKEVRVRVPGMSEGLQPTSAPLITQQTHLFHLPWTLHFIHCGSSSSNDQSRGLCRGNGNLCRCKGSLCQCKGSLCRCKGSLCQCKGGYADLRGSFWMPTRSAGMYRSTAGPGAPMGEGRYSPTTPDGSLPSPRSPHPAVQ